jgi:alkylated DNA repair dioxygenase AlkB
MALKPRQKTLALTDIKLHYAKIHSSNNIFEKHKLEPINRPITGYGAGDTTLYFDILSNTIKESAFNDLMKEIEWKHMNQKTGPVPRMISIQGNLGKDKFPLYRHPIDKQPDLIKWTPTVKKIKDLIEEKLNQPINHALVQYYKNGHSFIQQHADKTLDIKKETNIINVSFGSTRTMRLMNKKDTKPRDIQKIELINGSVLCMGWETNLKWVHGIRPDKRSDKSKRPDELLYDGGRISLTFRTIATYQHNDGSLSGQGAPRKKSERKHEEEALEMLKAFGIENYHSVFDWDKNYGEGFYALDLGCLN